MHQKDPLHKKNMHKKGLMHKKDSKDKEQTEWNYDFR